LKKGEEKGEELTEATKTRKRSVSYGKSTIYEVERDTDESTEFINKDGIN
jgi:hypothetical protein